MQMRDGKILDAEACRKSGQAKLGLGPTSQREVVRGGCSRADAASFASASWK
jgi:hypothetical protein